MIYKNYQNVQDHSQYDTARPSDIIKINLNVNTQTVIVTKMDEAQLIINNIPNTEIHNNYNTLEDGLRMNITNSNISTYRPISNSSRLEMDNFILFYRIVATFIFPTQLIVGEYNIEHTHISQLTCIQVYVVI